MNTTSISSQNTLAQVWAAQQAGAAAAISLDSADDDAFETGAASSSTNVSGTGLTGSTTGTLDSQTLQALLGLAQTDPSDDTSQDSASQGQTQSQTQATTTHHHHHHHGGMTPDMASNSSSATTTSTDSASDTSDDSQPANNDASDDLLSMS